MNKPEIKNAQNLHNDEKGASTVEYLILLALVAFVGFGVWATFGGALTTKGGEATESVNSISFPAGGG